jgi:hypothetical protein
MVEQTTFLLCSLAAAVTGGLAIFLAGFLIGLACRRRRAPTDNLPPLSHRQPEHLARKDPERALTEG